MPGKYPDGSHDIKRKEGRADEDGLAHEELKRRVSGRGKAGMKRFKKCSLAPLKVQRDKLKKELTSEKTELQNMLVSYLTKLEFVALWTGYLPETEATFTRFGRN